MEDKTTMNICKALIFLISIISAEDGLCGEKENLNITNAYQSFAPFKRSLSPLEYKIAESIESEIEKGATFKLSASQVDSGIRIEIVKRSCCLCLHFDRDKKTYTFSDDSARTLIKYFHDNDSVQLQGTDCLSDVSP